MPCQLPPIYLITDRQQLPAGRTLIEQLELLLQAGVQMLQLREKDLCAAELWPIAEELRALTKRFGCRLLINDRIDLAQAIDADGVHLGAHSLSVATARQLLGPDKLIGASTHTVAEITTADEQGADFVTFGPVFHTPSKAAYGAPVGLDQLQRICQISQIPTFALGGISAENCASTISHGATGIAMISALIASPSPKDAYRQLLNKLQ